MSDTVYVLVIVIPILLFSISVHESMHALAGYWLGDDTAKHQGRISLNPLRHVDPFLTIALPVILILSGAPAFGAAKPVEINFRRIKWDEFGAAIVGAVGPLTNFILAVFAALILNLASVGPGVLQDILVYTIIINIGFGVFNSIPWPPLDGSRVLYAFAPRPVQEFMESIEKMGILGLVIFMLLFFQFLSPILGEVIRTLSNGLLPGSVL
jgi:Zn-dependent protease